MALNLYSFSNYKYIKNIHYETDNNPDIASCMNEIGWFYLMKYRDGIDSNSDDDLELPSTNLNDALKRAQVCKGLSQKYFY